MGEGGGTSAITSQNNKCNRFGHRSVRVQRGEGVGPFKVVSGLRHLRRRGYSNDR